MAYKLTDLTPCASCSGPLRKDTGIDLGFEVQFDRLLLNPSKTNQVMGMNQYFGGALGLAEMFTPSPECVECLSEATGAKKDKVFICTDCAVTGVSIWQLKERLAEARDD